MQAIANWVRANTLFFYMVSLTCLLNISYTVLRSARNALVVADLGGGAGSIPWFELCGTMPGAVLMTLGLSYLLNRYSIRRVFFLTIAIFVAFFLIFTLGIYPLLSLFKTSSPLIPVIASMSFFVMAELWKIALFTVLFWGLVNLYLPLESAKKYYSPLMLGGSIGTLLAGPFISFCTSDFISHRSWNTSLTLLVGLVALLSLVSVYLFHRLWQMFTTTFPKVERQEKKKEPLSVFESLSICFRSKYLMLLAWVTIADYVAYALGEVVFLDIVKQKFPSPREYCDFMGTLSFWSGLLTAVSALVITPYVLKRCRWVVASLVTPVCLLVTEAVFFFIVCYPSFPWVSAAVVSGAAFFCLARAAKYTLFDTSKELSFVLLPPLEKMQGKLVVDGMCSRLGRGGGSCLTLVLIQLSGSVLATAPIAGAIAVLIAFSCVLATTRLGLLVEKQAQEQKAPAQ